MTVKFPQLRGRRILCSDFFSTDEEATLNGDLPKFDLVVGNPPFGKNTIGKPAEEWMDLHSWSVPDKDVGTLFLAKAAKLTSPGGKLCMIQSASVLLSMRGSTGLSHRRRIFLDFIKVHSVTNLSAFRPFKEVSVPACIVEFENVEPDGEPFWYECPKRTKTSQDAHHFIIEPHDVCQLYPEEVVEEPWVWSALMWGGQRDRALVRRLMHSPSIKELEEEGVLKTRRGVIRGNREREIGELYGRPLLEKPTFPALSEGLYLDAEALPKVQSKAEASIYSRDSTDFSAFAVPQLLIKMSWRKNPGRYQARLVESDQGVICSRAYVTVHSKISGSDVLEAACLAYNSQLANYYFLLTSGRFAFDRAEPTKDRLLTVPLPIDSVPAAGERRAEGESQEGEIGENFVEGLDSFEEVDRRAFGLFSFTEAESILIEDMVTYTLADWKNLSEVPGREPTMRTADNGRKEPDLWRYCDVLGRVLRAGYGSGMAIQTTIFTEDEGSPLPIRLVAVRLTSGESCIEVENIGSSELHRQLEKVLEIFNRPTRQYNYHQRCIRSFDYEEGGREALVVYLLKPDQMRYWTRSMAMRDADALVADLRMWSTSSGEIAEAGEVVPA